MAVFTYDTGRLIDVDIADGGSCVVSVMHDGMAQPHSYSVDTEPDGISLGGGASLSDLLERIGRRVWIKYRVRKVWIEDGTSRTHRVLIDVDDIGDVMDARSRFWEWSLLPGIGVVALVVVMILSFTGLGALTADATANTRTYVVANADVDGNTEIVKMALPSGPVTNLTNNPATDQDPALSPDGSKIAFVSNRETEVDNVWIMGSDGSEPRNLTFMGIVPSAVSRTPAFSPDGSKIAFSSTRYGTTDIWLMSSDGQSTWSVTYDSAVDTSPAFTSDGSRLVFSSNGRIVSTAIDGSDRVQLTDPAAADALGDYDPAVSPTGTHIAFWRDSYPGGSRLMLARTDGSELRVLDTGHGTARTPAWLPDSRSVAFASDRDQDSRGTGARADLYEYELDGGQVHRLTNAAFDASNPSIGDIAERQGNGNVGSSSPPASSFYFAEGTVRSGFVQYFTIQNPGDSAADALIEYQASNDAGAPVAVPSQTVNVGAGTRATVNVNAYLAASGVPTPINISARITSDSEIVAERAVYFSFDPGLGRKVDGGTALVGATSPATSWKFAEGTVRSGFVQYFTIQNPNSTTANVTITYQAASDSGAPIAVGTQQLQVPAGARATVNVNRHFASQGVTQPANVSAAITSDQPVVAERPMYYSIDPGLGANVDGGTVVVGKAG